MKLVLIMSRARNSATSQNFMVSSTIFPCQNIPKYNWMSFDEDQTDRMLAERRWHSSILDAWSLRGAKCGVVVIKFRDYRHVNEQCKSLIQSDLVQKAK
jgi:hypothetical protein